MRRGTRSLCRREGALGPCASPRAARASSASCLGSACPPNFAATRFAMHPRKGARPFVLHRDARRGTISAIGNLGACSWPAGTGLVLCRTRVESPLLLPGVQADAESPGGDSKILRPAQAHLNVAAVARRSPPAHLCAPMPCRSLDGLEHLRCVPAARLRPWGHGRRSCAHLEGCHGQTEPRNEAELARAVSGEAHGQTSLPMAPSNEDAFSAATMVVHPSPRSICSRRVLRATVRLTKRPTRGGGGWRGRRGAKSSRRSSDRSRPGRARRDRPG